LSGMAGHRCAVSPSGLDVNANSPERDSDTTVVLADAAMSLMHSIALKAPNASLDYLG
jgi:hypothetical protein